MARYSSIWTPDLGAADNLEVDCCGIDCELAHFVAPEVRECLDGCLGGGLTTVVGLGLVEW